MASLIGAHFRSNGIKQLPCRAVLSLNGVGLGGDETHPDTIAIVRDTRVFPGGETTPDFNTFQPSTAVTWEAYGQHWYKNRTENGGNFRDAWALNSADYYQLQNERGGNDPWDIQRMVDIERAISWAAGADGVKCCILNLAGGTPGDFELWKGICAPFIVEAWEMWGHVYGRHLYADKYVNDDGSIVPGQPQRVIAELEYLRSIGYGGGVVLTECGLFGGYGLADYDYFEQQVTRWEQALRPYADMFIGLCFWETGASEFEADYTDHIKQLLPYIQAGDLPRWTPPDGGGGTVEKQIEVTITTELPGQPVQIRGWDKATGRKVKYVQRRWMHHDGNGIVYTGWETIPIPAAIADLRGIEFMPVHDFTVTQTITVDCPDETTDPNPPPVVSNPLPQGALFADVSANNKVVNLAALKAKGVQGIGIRLSNGIRKNTDTTDANGVDKLAYFYIEEASALGMPWLGYHFSNEHYDDVEQVRHFLGIAQQAIDAGYIPEMGLWIDFETPNPPVQGSPTSEDRIELQLAVLATERPSFIGDYGPYTSKGWWDNKVPNAAAWVPALGLKSWAAAWVPVGTLVNGWPPSWWHPAKLKGFSKTHFWQWTSAGGLLVGHSVASLDLNYVGGTAVVPGSQPPTPPPPVGQTVDMTQYYLPPNGRTYGDISIKPTNWGQGDVRQQLQLHGGYLFVTKGGEFEKRMILDGRIYFLMDDSPGDGKYYTVNSPTGWIPAQWAVGQTFTRQEATTFYHKANCQPTGEASNWTNVMLFKALYGEWVSPYGLKLGNVAHLQWLVNGVIEENYWLGKNLGYVGWSNKHGRESWIKEIIPYTDQEPNKFAGSCYHAAFG